MRHYVAGQLALMRELTALYSPTINSYKRYVPGVWAPLTPSWGVDNRTCAVRLVDVGDRQRSAHRVPADGCGHQSLPGHGCLSRRGALGHREAAAARAGVEGGCQRRARAPTDLADGGQSAATKSKAARALFGADFVDHYLRTRDFEVRTFERAVTDFELARYFEVI